MEEQLHVQTDPQLRQLLFTYSAIYFLLFSALGILSPFVPVFFGIKQLYSASQIGLLLSIQSAALVIFSPLWGLATDRCGSLSIVLVCCLLVSQLLTFCLYFSPNYVVTLVIVILSSVIKAPVTSLLDTMVVGSLPDKSKYGDVRLWGAAGFGIFSFVGGSISPLKVLTPTATSAAVVAVLSPVVESYEDSTSIRNHHNRTSNSNSSSIDSNNILQSTSSQSFIYLFALSLLLATLAGFTIVMYMCVQRQQQQQGYGEVEMVDDQSTRGGQSSNDFRHDIALSTPLSPMSSSISHHAVVPEEDDEKTMIECPEKESAMTVAGDQGEVDTKIEDEETLKDNDDGNPAMATPVTVVVIEKTAAAGATAEATATAAVAVAAEEPTIYSVILTRKVAIFFTILLCSGVGSGVIDGFLFLRLQSLGASGSLLGSARFIMCFAEIPCFRMAGALHQRLGAFLLLGCCQLAFVIRFLWYAFLVDPVWVLPAEILHGVTFAIVWSTGEEVIEKLMER